MKGAAGWTHAAVIGALWGAFEVTLGTALQLGRMPLRGTLMAGAALVCLVTLRRIQPRPGRCIAAGMVAMVLKVFSLGGLFVGPLIGIALTALAVEVAFTFIGVRRGAAAVSGAVVVALHPVQMLLMTVLVAGPDAAGLLIGGLGDVVESLPVGRPPPGVLAAGLIGAWMVLGLVIGDWSWRISGRVIRRLGAP